MHLAISGVAEFEWEYWWLSVVKIRKSRPTVSVRRCVDDKWVPDGDSVTFQRISGVPMSRRNR